MVHLSVPSAAEWERFAVLLSPFQREQLRCCLRSLLAVVAPKPRLTGAEANDAERCQRPSRRRRHHSCSWTKAMLRLFGIDHQGKTANQRFVHYCMQRQLRLVRKSLKRRRRDANAPVRRFRSRKALYRGVLVAERRALSRLHAYGSTFSELLDMDERHDAPMHRPVSEAEVHRELAQWTLSEQGELFSDVFSDMMRVRRDLTTVEPLPEDWADRLKRRVRSPHFAESLDRVQERRKKGHSIGGSGKHTAALLHVMNQHRSEA